MGEFQKMGDGSDVVEPGVGTHDHDGYVPIVEPAVEITAVHTFKPFSWEDDPPFRTWSQILVENFNADLLDGLHASDLVTTIVGDDLEDRVAALEEEVAKLDEANELLRRILAEVTKQSVQLGEATDVRPTDQDVKEVWQ